MSGQARAKAIELLDHYITLLMSTARIPIHADTHGEIEQLVDAMIDASVEETTRILEERGKITP